jgi:hypothetical protein
MDQFCQLLPHSMLLSDGRKTVAWRNHPSIVSTGISDMLPIFVFIALPTLSLALLVAIICRRLSAPALHSRHSSSEAARRMMSRLEALKLLGLEPAADPRTIRDAYKRLMIQYHPDHGGSHHTAARLNVARDVLLRTKKSRAA